MPCGVELEVCLGAVRRLLAKRPPEDPTVQNAAICAKLQEKAVTAMTQIDALRKGLQQETNQLDEAALSASREGLAAAEAQVETVRGRLQEVRGDGAALQALQAKMATAELAVESLRGALRGAAMLEALRQRIAAAQSALHSVRGQLQPVTTKPKAATMENLQANLARAKALMALTLVECRVDDVRGELQQEPANRGPATLDDACARVQAAENDLDAIRRAVPRSDQAASLTDYFLEHYKHGGVFKHHGPDGFVDLWFSPGVGVLHHERTGINVWSEVLDLRSGQDTPALIVYHYMDKAGFTNVTHPGKGAADIWASLHSGPASIEGNGKADAWYGTGVYCTFKSPAEFASRKDVVDNSFLWMVKRGGSDSYERVRYCLPLLVSESDVYDVNARETPEMTQRDHWVVRVEGGEGAVERARARIEESHRDRHERISNRFGAGSEEASSMDKVLGHLLCERGSHEEAIPVLRRVVEAHRRAPRRGRPEAMAALGSYAGALRRAGRPAREAEPVLKKALELSRQVLGPNHPGTLAAIDAHAGALSALGREAEAEPLRRECLAGRRKMLGHLHPDTLKALDNHALSLARLGRAGEAVPLARECTELRTRALGPQHPDTLTAMGNYAGALRESGRADEAVPLARDCLERRIQALGEQHPESLTAARTYSQCLAELGRAAVAEALATDC